MEKKSLKGSLLLLLGSVIWGAAFAAQRVGMEHMGPFYFSGIRMLLAGIVMIPVTAWLENRDRINGRIPPAGKKEQRKAGLLCGLLLFAATTLQQVGLVSTSAGKAGFITALYVVLVPLTEWLILKKNPGRGIWISVALAVAALYLLCVPAEAREAGLRLQSGDLMILGCAVCFTGQILCVDHYAGRVSVARLSRDEFLVTGILGLIIAVFTESITADSLREALIPILYAGVMSGAVGYTLQAFGQRDTDPTVASLLMCLEAVFAVLTGVLLIGERMTRPELLGCVMMFCAVVLAQISPLLSRKKAASAEGGAAEKPVGKNA